MSVLTRQASDGVRTKLLSSRPARVSAAAVVVMMAAGLQVSLAGPLSAVGLLPNLLLLVVIAAAIAKGRDFASILGFGLGLALDLGPASDHLAGRWALAFVVVGFVVGTAAHARFRGRPGLEGKPVLPRPALMAVAAAGSFIGTSVFALSGLILHDPVTALPEVLQVIATASLSDALLGWLLLPFLVGVFDRLNPTQEN